VRSLFSVPTAEDLWHNPAEQEVPMVDGQDSLERAIAGALRAAIRDHGPITADKIGSAAKRVAGNLKNARLDGMAAALGRKGGLASKESGANFEKLGRKGGRAGKGTKKPRSEEARRRMLARRLIRAADKAGTIEAEKMVRLAPGQPQLHATTSLRAAADALGVARPVQDLLGVEWERA
jgi:hypothetical protein